jgi:hypothetical protein
MSYVHGFCLTFEGDFNSIRNGMDERIVKVGIAGFGTVGSGVAKLILVSD